jgi:hypothetical protein
MFGHRNTGAKGHVIVDGREVDETLQCVHCAKHWAVRHGSGIRRGFCLKCQGPTCGTPACCRCAPFEARLELREAEEQGKQAVINRLVARWPDLPLLPL